MTFEVGPAPWGCVAPALYARSLALLGRALDYVQWHNEALGVGGGGGWRETTVPVYRALAPYPYPRHANGDLAAMVHPWLQGRDFHPLRAGDPIFLTHALETIALGGAGDPGVCAPPPPRRQEEDEGGVAAEARATTAAAGPPAAEDGAGAGVDARIAALLPPGGAEQCLYAFFVNEAAYYEVNKAFVLAAREERAVRTAHNDAAAAAATPFLTRGSEVPLLGREEDAQSSSGRGRGRPSEEVAAEGEGDPEEGSARDGAPEKKARCSEE